MILNFLSALRTSATNGAPMSRRRHVRRTSDRCVGVVAGQTYPVENWCPAGVLLSGDERTFGIGQDISVALKFKLRGAFVTVDHRGRIVRKAPGKFALEFAPLTESIRRSFQQVVDDSVANEFAESQVG
ncbi:MAG: PilZ domain-containing protein [Rhodospirillales bacterium]|nr:PilZ domain-containing protein [Rhodospirillales bacterium]